MNIQKSNRKTQLRRSSRSAFTLIELLLVISIVAVLGTLAVGVIGSAQRDARVAASQSRKLLIEKAMEIVLEDFEVRRSPISFAAIGTLTNFVQEPVWMLSDSRNPALDDNFLLHARNLKRMIVADLIRSEFPGGPREPTFAEPNAALGQFPSATLRSYLVGPNGLQLDPALVNTVFRRARSANVARWQNFAGFDLTEKDPTELALLSDEELLEIRQADSAEILYAILSQTEYEGTNVIDSLGTAAVGDTDGDGVQEVIDAFGDPMAFEFHQPNTEPVLEDAAGQVIPIPVGTPQSGVWGLTDANTTNGFTMANFESVRPILPSDMRFYVTSKTLTEIEGPPVDFPPN